MKTMSRANLRKRHPEMSEQQIARMDAISDEVLRSYPVEQMLDDMVPVYQKHLSKSDVDAMIGFYSSPTGQKILHEMSAMTTEAMEVAYGRMQKSMDSAMQRIEEMAKESSPPAKKAATPKPQTSKPQPKK